MSRRSWAIAQALGGVLVLILAIRAGGSQAMAVAWDGLRAAGLGLSGFAVLATLFATTACAWRWVMVAESAGQRLGLRPAVAACYRSQLVNATVPGGVVGDVDRALGAAPRSAPTRTRVRTVVVERLLGQLVQIVMTGLILAWAPSPWRPPAPARLALTVALVLVGIVGLVVMIRRGMVTAKDGGPVVVASGVVVLAHTVTFIAVALALGNRALDGGLITYAFIVLAASALPIAVLGWGPREGVAVWAGVQLGLTPGTALAISVAYGLLTLIALAPGLLTFLPRRVRRPVIEVAHE